MKTLKAVLLYPFDPLSVNVRSFTFGAKTVRQTIRWFGSSRSSLCIIIFAQWRKILVKRNSLTRFSFKWCALWYLRCPFSSHNLNINICVLISAISLNRTIKPVWCKWIFKRNVYTATFLPTDSSRFQFHSSSFFHL